ncbi:L-aminoadipate-semialdehyde dehydrogenase-phosphopantetheinyl transferase [Diprion similis]|uniref:L-aminoadipate-semialdehyde dehydrogenase-phosphopantetheinyl transferase n=1 Tax=Diprion similis TaxID=362088 RepID=UPI001EF8A6A8|nr:L-aminoadipate-semialdehyde dehydrogenase-phosphopantetheinyl transferase [Diprion similis]
MIKMARSSVRWAFNWLQWDPSETEFLKAISCIQTEEKERIGRFVFKKDARASLAGRLLMRKFVNEYGNIPYNDVLFSRDKSGRPFVNGDIKNLNFNVSHQGSYTVFAGEVRNLLLGVDVMKLEYTGGKKLAEFFRIMNRNFSPLEWDSIRAGNSKSEIDQVSMFCRHWSLKESYVKAIGVGIAMDLSRISFKINSPLVAGPLVTDTELYLDGMKQNWLFEESLLDSDHCVSVALQENKSAPESLGLKFETMNFKNLMENSVSLHSLDLEYCKRYFSKPEQP